MLRSIKPYASSNLEGPYLSSEDGPRGAHDRAFIHDPDLDEFGAWQQAAGVKIALVTIAPEREGAVKFIRKLVENGTVCKWHDTSGMRDGFGWLQRVCGQITVEVLGA